MKTRYIPAACAAALLLTGCFHDFHEAQPGMGYIATALLWEQSEDAQTDIEHLDVAVLGASASFSKEYASAQEAAADLLAVPEGEYDLLVAANMTTDKGYTLEGWPATKAGTVQGSVAAVLSGKEDFSQAWFGLTHVSVQEGSVTGAQLALQRLLSPLTLDISHLPEGSTIKIMQAGAAKRVSLTEQDAAGRFGVPAAKSSSYQFLSGPVTYLLPTASNLERSQLIIMITTGTGLELGCICDAPRVDVGKHYTLQLDFNELQPILLLDSVSISPWEDSWVISGDILDPR